MRHKADLSVYKALEFLDGISRKTIVGRCGVGSDTFAECFGDHDIAHDALIAAQNAALSAWSEQSCADESAQKIALDAADSVFTKAGVENRIYLRDGTRGASVALAYMLSSNQKNQ